MSHAATAHEDAQRFLAEALAQVGDAIIILDNAQRITYLNAKAAAQYAVQPAEALGQPLSVLHQHHWLQASDEEAAYTALAQRGYWRGQNIHLLPSGRQLYVDSTVTVLKDAAGNQTGLMAVIRDITAQKEGEARLHEARERFRLAVEKAPLSFAQIDRELRYTWVHNTHPDFRAENLLGKRDEELITGPDVERLVQAKRQVLASGVGVRGEFTFLLSDGKRTYDTTLEPLRDASGAVIGMTSAALDITERKLVEAELRRSAEQLQALSSSLQELNSTLEQRVTERTAELERSNRELDRFAYVASHDLKAPLRAIDNLASWIVEDAAEVLPPPAQVHLTKLRSRVKRLEMLLDDLLLYSRAGRRRHTPERVDTRALVDSIVELLNPPPGFRVQIAGEFPTIRCERPSLELVLRNLMENAIKHHHHLQEGAVCIAAHRREHMVEFCVIDNGPGIDPQYHERIFEVFQTLRPRDEVESSGMGLAIVKKTVESAGGRVWVESTTGAGATFYFTWPAGEGVSPGSPPLSA